MKSDQQPEATIQLLEDLANGNFTVGTTENNREVKLSGYVSKLLHEITRHLEGRGNVSMIRKQAEHITDKLESAPQKTTATSGRDPFLEIKNGCYFSHGKRISDFVIELEVFLEASGRRTLNITNSSRSVVFNARPEDLSTSAAFRRFCLSKGPFHWTGGDKHLHELVRLIDEQTDPKPKQATKPRCYWIHGPKASGKTFLAQRIAGPDAAVIPGSSTKTALERFISENSGRPVVIEECRHEMPDPLFLLTVVTGGTIHKGSLKETDQGQITGKFTLAPSILVVCSEHRPDPDLACRFITIDMSSCYLGQTTDH